MSDLTTDPCIHTYLDNGIHEFAFTRSSRDAVDEMFVQLTQVYAGLDPEQTVLILFDFRQGDVPLSYLFVSFQKWLARRTTHYNARLVILTDSRGAAAVVDGLLRALHHSYLQARFFTQTQREEAITWLLQAS